MTTIRINLLPRRPAYLIRRTRRFRLMLAAAIASGLIILLACSTAIEEQRREQRQLIQALQTEHDALDRLIREGKELQEKIASLRRRQRSLESLQHQRNDAVTMLVWLGRYMPHDVYLQTMTQDGRRIILHGYAATHAQIAQLMENLHAPGSIFGQTELQELRTQQIATGQSQRFAIMTSYVPATSLATNEIGAWP